jgi:hypothetical protein
MTALPTTDVMFPWDHGIPILRRSLNSCATSSFFLPRNLSPIAPVLVNAISLTREALNSAIFPTSDLASFKKLPMVPNSSENPDGAKQQAD